MDKKDIINSLLSGDTTKVNEAKAAIKGALDARATQFRADSSKFIAKSLFEMTFDPPGFKVGATVDHAGAECVIDRIDGENLVLKTKEGSLYSVSKSDVKMTFTPPGVNHGAAGSVGNGLYQDSSNKGMIFTPPGGAANVK